MFGGPKRDSHHSNLYGKKFKNVDPDRDTNSQDEPIETGFQKPRDEHWKFKKSSVIDTRFEVYLETEKTYQSYLLQKLLWKEPMETVAYKIRRGLPLGLHDLKHWVSYNFFVLDDADQKKVKALYERQQWFWQYFSVLTPPTWFGIFSILRHSYRVSTVLNFFISSGSIVALSQIGLISSNGDMKIYFNDLYDRYKDEVLKKEYRGLKLHGGKRASQLDNKEFTSSNFDDLKAILFNQRKK